MSKGIDAKALATLFDDAHSAFTWSDRPVSDDTLKTLYDRLKFGPTSANCSPARFVFITSEAAKARLRPHLMEGNVNKVMTAPVTVIIGHDLDFADHLGTLFPHDPSAPSWFSDPVVAETTAFRNGTLQGAYLMLAARGLGLDCGPMSGFDNTAVDAEFFKDTRIKSNFLCALGHAGEDGFFPRNPRLGFDEAATIL